MVAIVAGLIPEDRYTGTNSVGVRSVVADVGAGQTICIPQLDVPDGTGRVRVWGFWQGARRPGFDVRLRAGEAALTGSVESVDRQGPSGAPVDVPVRRVETRGKSDPGRLCLTPRGGDVQLGGMADLQGDQRSPTIDGRPLGSRVAVWFLEPEGRERSAFSVAGDIVSRAALFRPGPIGSWTYVLLPLVWLLVAYGALRLLAAGGSVRRTSAAVGLIAFLMAGSWALVTPPFGAPDEPDHYGYAQALGETGKAPVRAPSKLPAYSSRATVALDALRIYSQVELPRARTPWLEVSERRWSRRMEAEDPPTDDGGGYLASTSTHAPVYYGLTLPAYAAAGGDTFSALAGMRLVSALLGALVAVCAFLAVRELAPRQRTLAVTAGLVVAFQPMFAFMSGALNNDAGVNAAAALLVLLLLRGLRRGLTLKLGIALGAVLVVLPLMKGTGYALYPAALVGLAGMLWRRHERAAVPAYAAVAASFVGLTALWSALSGTFGRTSFTTPGGISPTASGGIVGNALSDPGLYVSYLWQVFLPRLPFMSDLHPQKLPAFDIYVERGWAAFGWYAVKFPQWVYVLIALALLAGFALCAVAAWRERRELQPLRWELAVLLIAIAGVVGGVEAAYVTSAPRPVVAEQGRYAFTAMVPLATIAAGACLAFGRRRAPALAAGLVGALMGLSFLSLLLGLQHFYA